MAPLLRKNVFHPPRRIQPYDSVVIQMPLFSIIVPVYNVKPYLMDSLSSIASQTLRDFEVLVVDDGSNDGSGEIANGFCAQDPRFRYIRKANGGASDARNVGLAHSAGTYVYYMDADDQIVPTLLERCLKEFEATPVDLVVFDAESFPRSSPDFPRFSDYYIRPEMPSPASSVDFIGESIRQNRYFVSACCYVAKRETIGDLRFFKGMLYEDNPYMAAILTNKIISVGIIRERLFLRRLRPNSVMTSVKTLRNYESLYRLVEEMLNLPFYALIGEERTIVKMALLKGALLQLFETSGDIKPTITLRMRNIGALIKTARAISPKILSIKHILLAVFPELRRLKKRMTKDTAATI
jgi:glycosyltransferase involved in cell wall biosynthesis